MTCSRCLSAYHLLSLPRSLRDLVTSGLIAVGGLERTLARWTLPVPPVGPSLAPNERTRWIDRLAFGIGCLALATDANCTRRTGRNGQKDS